MNGAAYVSRRGASEAGALFIVLFDRESRESRLYEPAPQALVAESEVGRDDRAFTTLDKAIDDLALRERFDQESRFDPDFWVLELEGLSEGDLKEIVQIV